jgi:Bacterial regulatory proteins, luxR family
MNTGAIHERLWRLKATTSQSWRARLVGVGSLSHRFWGRPWSARRVGFGATPSRDLGSSAVTAPRPPRSPVTSTRRRGDLAARSEWALILDTGPIVALLDAGDRETEREVEVLKLLACGLSNKEIAATPDHLREDGR